MSTTPIPIDPELDAQLDVALEDTGAATATGAFRVTTLDHASWAVHKIAQHRAKLAEAEGTYEIELAQLDMWITDQRYRCGDAVAFLEALLRPFHETRLADDPKGAKTIRLPAGDLVARKTRDSLYVVDGEFIAWAEATGHGHLVRVTKAPAKAEIRKAIGEIMVDGQVVDAGTGEFMPGVTHIDGKMRFSVRTPEAEQ